MPDGFSSADTQTFVSNSATRCTSPNPHFSSGCGDIGFDAGGLVSAGAFPKSRQQGIKIPSPLRFGIDGDQTNFLLLQAETLEWS